ncbi:hypothetical protein ACJX0J_028092, partial [Zea mays]
IWKGLSKDWKKVKKLIFEWMACVTAVNMILNLWDKSMQICIKCEIGPCVSSMYANNLCDLCLQKILVIIWNGVTLSLLLLRELSGGTSAGSVASFRTNVCACLVIINLCC